MEHALTWSQLGMLIGGLLVGSAAGSVFLFKYFPRDRKGSTTGDHVPTVRRDEFTLAMSDLRVRIEESHMEAREARAAANATQVSLGTIGQMIESSMRSLGDRLEGALRDVKDRVDGHDGEITDHHGRLRAVETEIKIRRGD
jgi:uncharacterized membrane protein